MAVVILIGSQANAAGGGDIALNAMDWTNLTVTSGSGIETTNEVTVAGINSPVVLRAEWTSASANPTQGQWVKNGAIVSAYQLTPIEATVTAGSTLKWRTYAAYTHPSGNSDSGTVTVTNRTQRGTCTMTIASPCVVTKAGHQLAADMRVRFSTTGALPTGITAGTVYWVIAAGLTADDCQISATQGGAAINTSGSQSGTHTVEVVVDTFTYACQYVVTGGGGGGGGYHEPPGKEPP